MVSLVGRTTTGSSSLLPAPVSHDGELRGEAFDMLRLPSQVAFGDEQRKVGVRHPGGLDPAVDLRLHPLPDGVAVGTDDHRPPDGAVVGQLGFGHDVLVPAGEVGRLGEDALRHVPADATGCRRGVPEPSPATQGRGHVWVRRPSLCETPGGSSAPSKSPDRRQKATGILAAPFRHGVEWCVEAWAGSPRLLLSSRYFWSAARSGPPEVREEQGKGGGGQVSEELSDFLVTTLSSSGWSGGRRVAIRHRPG